MDKILCPCCEKKKKPSYVKCLGPWTDIDWSPAAFDKDKKEIPRTNRQTYMWRCDQGHNFSRSV